MAKVGITLLDTPVSGTRNSILGGTLALYGSGDDKAWEKVQPVLKQFAKTTDYLGEFGNASKLKYILNHLVAVHNAATAEAMTLAKKGGLDIAQVQRLVADTYASSGVWRGRGKMMVDRDFVPMALPARTPRSSPISPSRIWHPCRCSRPPSRCTAPAWRRATWRTIPPPSSRFISGWPAIRTPFPRRSR